MKTSNPTAHTVYTEQLCCLQFPVNVVYLPYVSKGINHHCRENEKDFISKMNGKQAPSTLGLQNKAICLLNGNLG